MMIETGGFYWHYILSMACLGTLVGYAINLVSNNRLHVWSGCAQAGQCSGVHRLITALACTPFLGQSFRHFNDSSEYHQSAILAHPLLVQIGTGFLFGLVSYRFDMSLAVTVRLVYIIILILISTIDIKRWVVPNRIVYPSIVLVFILFPMSQISSEKDIGYLYLVSLQGVLTGFLLLLFIYLCSRGGIGAGDVKLGALIGAATGLPLILESLALSFVTVGVAAILLVTLKKRSLQDRMPFAPYLTGATIITLLFGARIPEIIRALL